MSSEAGSHWGSTPPERDEAIRAIVTRLSRPHPSGGAVIERAAIVAEGADATSIVRWILAHAGQPETVVPTAPTRGLHGARLSGGAESHGGQPRRYVLPVGALTERAPAAIGSESRSPRPR